MRGSTCMIIGPNGEEFRREVKTQGDTQYIRYQNKIFIVEKIGEYSFIPSSPQIKRDLYKVVREATL